MYKPQGLICTAKSKRSKQRCKNAACIGAHTCRMHGGRHPRGADAPQARSNLKHGLRSKVLLPEERETFDATLTELLERPKEEILRHAAFIIAKAHTVAGRADPKTGMLVIERVAAQKLEAKRCPGHVLHLNSDGHEYVCNGGEVMLDDAGKPIMVPAESQQSAKQVDLTGPVTELLMKADRLVEAAHLLEKKGVGAGAGGVLVLDKDTAASVMREVFGDPGGLAEGGGKPDGGSGDGGQ